MNSGLGTMNSMNTYMTMNTMSTSGNMTPASFNMSYANPGLGAGLSPGAVAGMPGGSAGAMNSMTAGVTAMGTTLSPGGMGAMGAQPAASMNGLGPYAAAMNLHFKQLSGENNHHIAECAFKAFAKALDQATQYDPRIMGVLSTKGSL